MNDNLTLPLFNANSEMFQNIGLLKVAETAVRRCGDKVVIRTSDTRDLYLLSGADSVDYWRRNQAHFQTDLGEIHSNAEITRLLLGQELSTSRWQEIWLLTTSRLTALNRRFEDWLERALVEACAALLRDLPACGETADLRDLCRDWSIRAVCPAVFGRSLPDAEIAQGIADVESFYFAMSTRDLAETADYRRLPEFVAARGFLDRVMTVALEQARPQDETLIAQIDAVIPEDVALADRLDLLRPTVGRMITEKLNIGGLSLLWTLSHLARAPDLSDAIAAELDGKEIFALADGDSPLALSVVQEGLRLYPELPFIYRIASAPVEIGPLRVPAGATVVFAPWLNQRDGRLWDDPARFVGDRFVGRDYARDAYLPFGVGPRTRTRGRFIQHQILQAVRAVCAETRPWLAPECPRGNLQPLLRSALIPRGAVPVGFTPRRSLLAA
ncbi:MAG: cytochrome P450 [Paenirhodobacter sp.]|uniref:cytochrome P450 n=1 Tax=Paenirhodobacter sp. TaxID=1965326 RepID=UPI003D1275EE